jgi:hypothetical protein
MYSLDSYTAKIMVGLRRREIFFEELENSRSVGSRGMRGTGLACQGGRALVQVGRQLVALGHRLERLDTARSSV